MKIKIIFDLIISLFILSETNGKPLSKDTLKTAKRPDEQSNLFEGDMRFPPPTARGVFKRGHTIAWPNGIVPYEIAPGYEAEQERFILSTMQRMENALAVNNALCIDFRPKTSSDKYYLTIRNEDGCWSYVGQNPQTNRERTVSLEYPGCFSTGIVMHELLHALGFYHEQSRPDRDNHVRIHHQNIESGEEHNFEKYDNTFVDTLNTPYDYQSVMHYRSNAFASDIDLPTIEPLDSNAKIGQRIWLSPIDIAEVRLVYNCSSTGVIIPTGPTTRKASNYSSALTSDDRMYMRPEGQSSDHYYEAIEIMVNQSGIYEIKSVSNMDTLGYLYDGSFNPINPLMNIYEHDDDEGGNNQFEFSVYLEVAIPYTLVVSTHGTHVTGPFSIVATGPDNVRYSTLDSTGTTTVRPSIIDSSYSNTLVSDSATFSRDDTAGSVYYYDPIAVGVKTSGTYTFKSSASFDAYGYLYQTNFDPSSPLQNRLLADDDSAGSGQFQLTEYLHSNYKYILIVTTFGQRDRGQFSVVASGPDNLSLI